MHATPSRIIYWGAFLNEYKSYDHSKQWAECPIASTLYILTLALWWLADFPLPILTLGRRQSITSSSKFRIELFFKRLGKLVAKRWNVFLWVKNDDIMEQPFSVHIFISRGSYDRSESYTDTASSWTFWISFQCPWIKIFFWTNLIWYDISREK